MYLYKIDALFRKLTFLYPRLEIKKVLVVLTDGRSNTGHVSGPARQLKNSGVVIFSVGIGHSVSQQELRVMASDPADQHVIMLGNFTELESLSEKMSSQTCNGKCNGWWITGSGGNDHSVHDEGRDNGACDDGASDCGDLSNEGHSNNDGDYTL